MGLIQLNGPQIEPVSLEQTKSYLRIDHRDEDDLLCHLITVARQSIESYTAQSLIQQEWRFTFNAQFGMRYGQSVCLSDFQQRNNPGIHLPRSPFVKLSTPPLLITKSKSQTIKNYKLNGSGRMAWMTFDSNLSVSTEHEIIQIDFLAGYGPNQTDVPAPFRQAILMTIGHLYAYQSSANDNGLMWLPLNETVVQLIKPYRILRLN